MDTTAFELRLRPQAKALHRAPLPRPALMPRPLRLPPRKRSARVVWQPLRTQSFRACLSAGQPPAAVTVQAQLLLPLTRVAATRTSVRTLAAALMRALGLALVLPVAALAKALHALQPAVAVRQQQRHPFQPRLHWSCKPQHRLAPVLEALMCHQLVGRRCLLNPRLHFAGTSSLSSAGFASLSSSGSATGAQPAASVPASGASS